MSYTGAKVDGKASSTLPAFYIIQMPLSLTQINVTSQHTCLETYNTLNLVFRAIQKKIPDENK